MGIGKELAKQRESKGFSQEELADKVGMTRSYLSRIENEHVRPQYETIDKLFEAMGVRTYIAEMEVSDPARPPEAEDAPNYTPHDIPEVGLVQAGRGRYFDEVGNPTGEWPRQHHRPEDVKDPNAYMVRVEGDSMEPSLKKGHRLLCVTDQEAVPGDLVVVQMRSGEVMAKELTIKDGMIVLKSVNPLYDPIVLAKQDVRAIHPVVWVKRK